jgi:hypothetical protein
MDRRVTKGSLGTTHPSQQSNRILTFLPSIRIRSSPLSRLDMDITPNRTIWRRRSRTYSKAWTRQYRRSQGQCHVTICPVSPRAEVSLWQKHPSSHFSNRRLGTTMDTKVWWTTQTTQPMGRSFHHIKSYPIRFIWINDQRWRTCQELVEYRSITKISCLKRNSVHKKGKCNQVKPIKSNNHHQQSLFPKLFQQLGWEYG